MILGFGIRAILQAFYFIVVARAIGPEQYGLFAGTSALIGVLAPYASWGSGNILVKYVSRDSKLFSKYWGASLATTIISSVVLTFVAIFAARIFLPETFDLWLVLSICISELFFARIISICAQVFQSVQRLSVTAQIFIIFSVFRLISALLFVSAHLQFTARNWSFFFLLSSVLSAIPALLWVYRSMGWGKLSLAPMLSEFKEGFYFSLSLSSQGFYNDIDKTLLARMTGLEVAGFYAVAYRIIDVAFVPITALLNSTYARFFQHGESGLANTKKFALKLLPWAFLYSILAGSVIFLTAPLLPRFLGQSYNESATILLWLIPLLSLKAAHYLAADSLTGAGFQGIRSKLQLLVSGVNLLLNLWAIPLWGWKGAVFVSWASDGLLAILLWWIVLQKSLKNSKDIAL